MRLSNVLEAALNAVREVLNLDLQAGAAPATPDAGFLRVYATTGKKLAVKDDTGAESVLGGALKQRVTSSAVAATSGTSNIPIDDTLPQSSEGTEIMSVSITPQSTSNKLLVRASVPVSVMSGGTVALALFRGTTCVNAVIYGPDPQGTDYYYIGGGSNSDVVVIEHAETVTGTAPQTWSLRIGVEDTAGVAPPSLVWAVGFGSIVGITPTPIFGAGIPAPLLTVEEFAG
jgi:hypothetical protein